MTKLHETIHEVRMAFLQTLVDGQLLGAKLERMGREKAQKDLEKSPLHKWEHGDVFRFSEESIMIYIHVNPNSRGSAPQVFRISNEIATTAPPEVYLRDVEFLFNIKEKL